jgi:ferredoxin
MKIIQEREKCIGCGSCASLCPKFWEMAEDGKSKLIGAKKNPETGNEELEIEEVGCNREAANACPVQIIHIEK